MENPTSLYIWPILSKFGEIKNSFFFSYRTKKQGKIHMYFKKGQIIFLGKKNSYLIIFPIQKSAHYKIALHHYIHLETCSVLLLAGGRGGFMCEFPQVMQIANLPDYIPLNWFISSWISINWKIEVGPAVINFNTQSMLFLIYQEYLQEHYTKNTKFRNPMQEREKRERREERERKRGELFNNACSIKS